MQPVQPKQVRERGEGGQLRGVISSAWCCTCVALLCKSKEQETISSVKQCAEMICCSRRSKGRAAALLGAGLVQVLGRSAGFVLS